MFFRRVGCFMRNQASLCSVNLLRTPGSLAVMLLMIAFLFVTHTRADGVSEGDWPMVRYNAQRTASSPHELSGDLHLHWVRQLPEPRRAWPWQIDDFEKLAFDKSYQPVSAGGLLYVPSMVTDCVTAYEVESGVERWRYFTDGPVRLAPLAWQGRLYVASDDGAVHCLDGETGERIWKFSAAPSDRKVLGNERIISLWPVRGGPVIEEGTLYFAAGLWPHEGVFVYALDAETAEIRWVNSGSASELIMDSKRYHSFGGVVPQGHLAVQGDRLFVPGGRTAPAVFDRDSGELCYFNVASETTGRSAGGHEVFVRGDWFFNVRDAALTHMYAIADGAQFDAVHVHLASEDALIGVEPQAGRIRAFSSELESTREETSEVQYDRLGRPLSESRWDASRRPSGPSGRLRSRALRSYYQVRPLWESDAIDGLRRLHLKAGATLYGSGEDGRVFAAGVPSDGAAPELRWTKAVDGEVFSMLAARERLFVVTEPGRIYCFGPGERETTTYDDTREALDAWEASEDGWAERVSGLLAELDSGCGYALVFGIGSGRLLEELLHQSDLHVTAFDPDPERVDAFRRRFARAGLYGRRVAVHEGDATSVALPPYIANLIVSEDSEAAGADGGAAFARALFHPLRPYGGTVYLALPDGRQDAFAAAVEAAELENARLSRGADHVLLSRPGALPGAAAWTHQYADAGNTVYSPDDRVRAPLGVTWFGGPTNDKLAPSRHANFPIPQVVHGRAIVLGERHISARCVYTGRELWERELEEFGYLQPPYLYDPGANFIGSPYVSTTDSVYLIYQDRCLRLDIGSGETLDSFTMPDRDALHRRATDPPTQQSGGSFAAQLEQRGMPGEVTDEAIPRAIAQYPFAYDVTSPEDLARIEPGAYFVGIVGRTGHRHRSNRHVSDYRLSVDGARIELSRNTPERGRFFEDIQADYRSDAIRHVHHAAGGMEIGTVISTAAVELGPDSELDIRRWSRSEYERVLLFRSAEDVARIPGIIGAFMESEPVRFTGQPPRWGSLRVSGDFLIVAAHPHMFDDLRPGWALNWNATSSEFIVAMNRFSGEIQWAHPANHGFRHNAIAASSDKVFVIDHLSPQIVQRIQRRGIEPDVDPEVRALDLASGTVLWRCGGHVFGTWLSYSEAHDVLLQSGRPGGFGSLSDEPRDRKLALRGDDGSVLWQDSRSHRRGPLGLHESSGQVIASIGEDALDIRTGEPQLRQHPITGRSEPWRWVGALRCGTQNYSRHLITFRSGAGGFTDLTGGGQSGNITGFRPGCTNNLVAADGVLTALDYSRNCSCSYQHQTSFGLVHMPEVEMWTFSSLGDPAPGTIRRGGINLGAPGSRLDAQGDVLWVEYPARVGPTPEIPIVTETRGEQRSLRHHASVIRQENGSHRWVLASGIEGEMTLRLEGLHADPVADGGPGYTVRLHFAELDHHVQPGQRVFDVLLNDEMVLQGLDVVAKTGGPFRGATEAFSIDAGPMLSIEVRNTNGAPFAPLLCGIEFGAIGDQ